MNAILGSEIEGGRRIHEAHSEARVDVGLLVARAKTAHIGGGDLQVLVAKMNAVAEPLLMKILTVTAEFGPRT